MQNDTLDIPINKNPVDNRNNKEVKAALDVIAKFSDTRSEVDSRNNSIRDLFEEAFIVSDPTGTRKLSSQRLYQAIWRTVNRMKPLDFAVHGANRPPFMEKIMTDGIWTVMERGGYTSCFRDKGGLAINSLMYGDSFMMIGANPNKKASRVNPVLFTPIANDSIYVDNYAHGIRLKGFGRSASKMVVIFSYSWSKFCELFPTIKTKAGIGAIPRQDYGMDLERTFNQEKEIKDDETEVAHFYDITNLNYTSFAGKACTIIESMDGNNYPFWLRDEPYIPISQFICIPSSEGFHNYGIGALLYKLAILSRQLMNMEYAHVEDSTYPIELVSIPQGEAAKFFNKLSLAHEMRGAGKKAFVAMEYDPNNPNSSGVKSQTLLTQNLVSEWQMLWDVLVNEIQMLGINLRELEINPQQTATKTLADEENSNAFVKQMMEYNASESQFIVDCTMDMIKNLVGRKNKTPINLTTRVKVGEVDVKADMITLGDIAEELKQHNYFVKVNARTGAIPSNVGLLARYQAMLPLVANDPQAAREVTKRISQLYDLDLPLESSISQEQPARASMTEGRRPEVISETDRLTINPYARRQVPVL